jgi:RNA polymerase sigma factor (sigma-70 family)
VPDSADPIDPSAPLLRRWQDSGDADALDRLLQIEVGVLKHMIQGRRQGPLAGSAGTSDIAQEAVMGLLKTKERPKFSNPAALRGYLCRSAWHLLVKRYEKQQRMPLRVDLDDTLELEGKFASVAGLRNMDRAERAMAIGLAMNLLSREDRELLRLVYFEDREAMAAGEQLGLSRGTTKSRLVRARRLLATRLVEWTEIIG